MLVFLIIFSLLSLTIVGFSQSISLKPPPQAVPKSFDVEKFAETIKKIQNSDEAEIQKIMDKFRTQALAESRLDKPDQTLFRLVFRHHDLTNFLEDCYNASNSANSKAIVLEEVIAFHECKNEFDEEIRDYITKRLNFLINNELRFDLKLQLAISLINARQRMPGLFFHGMQLFCQALNDRKEVPKALCHLNVLREQKIIGDETVRTYVKSLLEDNATNGDADVSDVTYSTACNFIKENKDLFKDDRRFLEILREISEDEKRNSSFSTEFGQYKLTITPKPNGNISAKLRSLGDSHSISYGSQEIKTINNILYKNGVSFGALDTGNEILVEDGKVYINGKERVPCELMSP